MTTVRFHFPFAGLNGCHEGGGNGLTKASLIKHLHDRHCNGDAQAITKHSLLSDLVGYERAELTFKRMGIWLCGVCFKTHTLRIKCRHGLILCHPMILEMELFVLYYMTLQGPLFLYVLSLFMVKAWPNDIACWVSLLVLPLCLLKTFSPRSNLECSVQLVRETLAESVSPMLDLDEEDLDLTERNLKQCKRKIYDGHYTTVVRVLSSYGVAPYNDATLQELKAKHPFKSAPSLPDTHIDRHPLIASQDVVLDRLKSFPRGTSCGCDGLRAQHLMDCLSRAAIAILDELVSSITQVVNLFLEGKCLTMVGEYIASASLTPLVKPDSGIRLIAVGTVWRRMVSKVCATMIGHSLDGYLDGLQFCIRIPGGGEAIFHAVNRLLKDHGDDVGLLMLLVDFQNAFNLSSATLTLPNCTTENTPFGRAKRCSRAWYLDDGTIVGDTLVVGKVLELITEDGPRCGLHLNVDKTELFWPKEDPKSRLEGVFPPNISRPLHGVKLLGGPVSVDLDFSNAFVMKRVSKTIGLLDAVAKINDPQCKFQLAFDMALHSALKRIVTASGPGFGDWQWRLAILPFAFGGLGTRLLRHVGLAAYGSTFDDALCVFNTSMEIDFLDDLMAISKGRVYFGLASCGSDLWVGTDNER
ncbi:hypothetical protein Tco_0209901 [Tanacetum coccineum]